jgi:hypothetical protein
MRRRPGNRARYAARRRDLVEPVAELALLLHQVEVRLKAQEESRVEVEVAREAQVGIRGDRPLAEHEFVDTAGRDLQRTCQRVLAHAHRLEKLLEQDLPRMRI